MPGQLYAILDLGYVSRAAVAATAHELCAGGVDLLQLRAKDHTADAILGMAREARPICADHGVPFIVNDFPEIAAEVGADGVHIGQDDGSIADARIRSGCRLIGRSTHSLAQAEAALDEGADHIGFGPLHATATKPGRPAIGLGDIAEAQRRVGGAIPIYCIGGITLDTLPAVRAAGAENVVIVSDLLQSGDIAAYIRRAKALLAAPEH